MESLNNSVPDSRNRYGTPGTSKRYYALRKDEIEYCFSTSFFGKDWFKKLRMLPGVRSRKKEWLYVPARYFPDEKWPSLNKREITFWHTKYGNVWISAFGVIEI